MHNVLSLKQEKKKKKNSLPNQSTMALLTHWEAVINHKNPFDLISLHTFLYLTPLSPSAHKINLITLGNKKEKKTIDCTGPNFFFFFFLYLCICVCKRDDIHLYVFFFFNPIRLFVCVHILYTCVWGLHTSFFGSTYKHTAQKMYKPWIYEQGSKEQRRGRSTEWSLIKMGQHMVNHSVLQTCSALIKCT